MVIGRFLDQAKARKPDQEFPWHGGAHVELFRQIFFTQCCAGGEFDCEQVFNEIVKVVFIDSLPTMKPDQSDIRSSSLKYLRQFRKVFACGLLIYAVAMRFDCTGTNMELFCNLFG